MFFSWLPMILALILEFDRGFVAQYNTLALFMEVDRVNCIESKTVSHLTITQTDEGKQFTVRQGDAIVINLPENPTTGYQWAIDRIDSNLIELQNSKFTLSQNASLGSGGERIFTFKTKATGTAKLELKKWRPWEGDRSIIQRFKVTLQIEN